MSGVARVDEAGAREPLQQERDPLEAVAPVGKTGMREETDHRLVELDPLGGLWAVGRDRTLGPLGGDGTGAVGEQQSGEHREAVQDVGGGTLAQQGCGSELRHRRLTENHRHGYAAETLGGVRRGRCGGADHRAEQLQPPGQFLCRDPRDLLVRQGLPDESPSDGGHDTGDLGMPALGRQPAQRHRGHAAFGQACEHRLGDRVGIGADRQGAQLGRRRVCREVGLRVVDRQPAAGEEVDEAMDGMSRGLGAARPGDGERGGDDRVGGVTGSPGRVDGCEGDGAGEVDVGTNRHVDERPVALARATAEQGQDEVVLHRMLGRLEDRHAPQAGHLGQRVHLGDA
ncbi:MAG: hypothetical protein BWY91_01072 [bacterium ADurb.BinA028]|nr:MAG: hypothetical protein BWY91_01072 [bacterium ADurb.BinA028]